MSMIFPAFGGPSIVEIPDKLAKVTDIIKYVYIYIYRFTICVCYIYIYTQMYMCTYIYIYIHGNASL